MKKRVLVVEDSISLASMITAVITHAEHNVAHAENGEVALKLLNEVEFNLIMLDLMMPVMDGKEFLQYLRTELKLTIPVIVYTGSQDKDIKQELIDIGANEVVFKPLGAQKLMGLIQEHIN